MPTGAQPDRLELTAATLDQKPVIANLLELYSHDFSEFIPLEISPDGRFGYPHLDLYWTDSKRAPLLLYVNSNLAGFVLVRKISEYPTETPVWDLVEFFIVRGFRRRGIGTQAAHEVFARFPGLWQVRVMQLNRQACSFWNRAVRSFMGGTVRIHHATDSGKDWTVFSFNSPAG